jgi:superfamily II DNA or RNA helicase
MLVEIKSPSKAYYSDMTLEESATLLKEMTYINTSAQHLLKRHYHNKLWRYKNADSWQAKLEELKLAVNRTLIFEDEGGRFMRPGSIPYLQEKLTFDIINNIKYPTPKKIAWAKPLPFVLHDYQEISAEKLIEIKHGNVELCTASGKSAILLKVCRETGFKTAVIAPSVSVFNELVEKFELHLGRGNVGKFGDGKKKLGKRITICIGDSVANIKRDTPEWEFFSKLEMMCVDESHTWGADSLEEICHGVLADIPYRMFFSGTQTRGDGADRLLYSIIGKTVHTLTTAEAKEKGYISDHEYCIVETKSSNGNYLSPDALEMKRIHFLGNRNIAEFIANLANASALVCGQQTLVLVEELSQISMLTKLLKVPFAYAHSEKKPARLAELGLEKVDAAESVEKFNKNEVQVLVGTSCIHTGTNIYPTHNTANWVGGTSEIKTKQGTVGRSVRKGEHNPYADKCKPKDKAKIWDFDVTDVYLMSRHLEDRTKYYKESDSPIKRIKLKSP